MSHTPSGDFLQWLQTFVLVSETQNIHQAANILCISPSAVSHHVKKLENDVSMRLFDRKNTGMHLTEEGRRLKADSLPVLDAVEQLRIGKTRAHQCRGPIRLTCVNRFGVLLAPHMVAFRVLNPEVSFILEPTSASRVVKNIDKGLFDLGITIYGRHPGYFDFVPLRDSSACLFTPSGNPYGLPEHPSWEQVCTLPFISLTLEGFVNPVASSRPDLRGPGNIVMAINDFLLAMTLVKGGLGVCIAPPLTPLENPADYTVFSLDHIFPVGRFGFLLRRDRYISAQARAFLTFLVSQYKDADCHTKGIHGVHAKETGSVQQVALTFGAP